jgi:hypothetical protein
MTVRHLLSRNSKYEFNIILFICLVVIASVKNVACNQPNIIFIIADDLVSNLFCHFLPFFFNVYFPL